MHLSRFPHCFGHRSQRFDYPTVFPLGPGTIEPFALCRHTLVTLEAMQQLRRPAAATPTLIVDEIVRAPV